LAFTQRSFDGYVAQASATGTSPLTLTTDLHCSTTRAYTAALVAANGVGAYTVTVQAPDSPVWRWFQQIARRRPAVTGRRKSFQQHRLRFRPRHQRGIDGLVANRVGEQIKVMTSASASSAIRVSASHGRK